MTMPLWISGGCQGKFSVLALLLMLVMISACSPAPATQPSSDTQPLTPPAASPTLATKPQTMDSATATAQVFVTAQPAATNPPLATSPAAGPAGVIDGPLSVVIESPADMATVHQSPLEITGQADPNTVITIGDTILLVGEDRRFQAKVDLFDGINLIEIIASDFDENEEAFYLTVDYEP